MKILLLTAWYHPFIHPRAHRWTAVAEHWALQGHEVQVLTARVGGEDSCSVRRGVQLHRVGYDSLKEWVYHLFGVKNGRGRVGLSPGYGGKWLAFLECVYKVSWKNLYFPDDACIWYFPARKKLFQLLENESFDALITVSLPFTGHLLGLAAKRRFPAVHWLADTGDPFSLQLQSPNNRYLYGRSNRRLEEKVLATADVVTVTTDAVRRKYGEVFGAAATGRIRVIPPLFASPEATGAAADDAGAVVQKQPGCIQLGYFGALYAPTRTPDVFLQLLEQTFERRKDLLGVLQVHFYGEIFPEFFKKLSGIPFIRLHGLRSRAETWVAMKDMDILVNIGNATGFQLPSKVVDYMASGKPVLNIAQVEEDPFATFFYGYPLIFNLLITEQGVNEADLQRWINWLDSEKPTPDKAMVSRLLEPSLVENVAAAYFKHLYRLPYRLL